MSQVRDYDHEVANLNPISLRPHIALTSVFSNIQSQPRDAQYYIGVPGEGVMPFSGKLQDISFPRKSVVIRYTC